MANSQYTVVWHNARPVSSRRHYVVGNTRHLITRHLVWKGSVLIVEGSLAIVFRGQLINSWYVGVDKGKRKSVKVLQGPFDDVESAFAMAKLLSVRV